MSAQKNKPQLKWTAIRTDNTQDRIALLRILAESGYTVRIIEAKTGVYICCRLEEEDKIYRNINKEKKENKK